MMLLNFRRARGLASNAATNIAKHNRFVARETISQRGSYYSMERRGIYQHASVLSPSSSLRTSRNELCEQLQTKTLQPKLSRSTSNIRPSIQNQTVRSLSFYNDPPDYGGGIGQPNMGAPAYTVFGEETAFSLKAIPPEFRVLPSGTVVLDASKRGRLLFEWTPIASGHDDYGGKKRYRWDASTRFALTAEEAASLLAKLDRGDPSIEFSRRVSGDPQYSTGQFLDKIFVAKTIELESAAAGAENGGTKNDGISLLVDYVDPDKHQLGQVPHPQRMGGADGGDFGNEGIRGPFEIRLMVGEYQVLRSIIEYSIPKLVGWSTMFDRNIEQAVTKSVQGNNLRGGGGGYGGGSPHNYQGDGNNY